MAGEEDTELRDLVAQTLEAKGVLGKIRVGSNDVREHVFNDSMVSIQARGTLCNSPTRQN